MSRPRPSHRASRALPWVLGCLLAGACGGHASAAEREFADWLAHDWHEVEVVVFLHRSVQTRELLTRFDPRRYPLPLTGFDPPPSAWRQPAAHALPATEAPVPPAWLWMDPPSLVPLPEPARSLQPGVLPRPLTRKEVRALPPSPEAYFHASDDSASSDDPASVPEPEPAPIPPPAPETIARAAFAAFEEGLVRASMQWRTDGLSLTPHVRRMRRSPDYEVLHHGRWFQAAASPRRALPVLLQLGAPGADGLYRLEGTLRVARGTFVEVNAELWLHEGIAGPAAGEGGQGQEGYAVLSETRRMRTGDIHYLDHPRIGLVLRADRLDVPPALAALVEAVEEGLQ